MEIRKFETADAEAVSALVVNTLRTVNIKDYSQKEIEELVQHMQPADILKRAEWTHFYVIVDEKEIVGCGAIGPYWDSIDESSLFTIFVAADHLGKGIGRLIIETLEQDTYALRAKRIEIPASITGLEFYKKMGYTYKNGNTEVDEEGLYRLEKWMK